MGDDTLVSVCIPTYNDGDHLRESLASILRQTYEHMEILVSDDASQDATPAVVASFNDSRIRYMRNETNLGIFENVNGAVLQARGDLIAIYHSDDVYEPTIVEREAAYLRDNIEVGAVFALDRWIDSEGHVIGQTELPDEIVAGAPISFEEVVRFFLRNQNRLLRCPTFMGRADILAEVGPFDQTFPSLGDVDMWVRLAALRPVAVLGEHLMRYRVGEGQVSARYDRLRTEESHFFCIMDRVLAESATTWMDSETLGEYAFHRYDDQTFRAANLVILGEPARARDVLKQQRFPWATLRHPRRRKLRTLLLRTLLRAGITAGAAQPLGKLVRFTEYGRRT